MRKIGLYSLLVLCLCATDLSSHGETIVQMGTLSGGKGQQSHEIILNQFDTQGGTLQLNFVQIDFLTSVIGGYETNGNGTPVHIFAMLSADYSLNGDLLAQTLAQVDTVVPNTSPGAATVFNTDTAQVLFDQAPGMAPWIGSGQITLSALTNFVVFEDPAGIINFGAGGTARYTVTYDYSAVPGPGALLMMIIPGFIGVRRRRG